MLFGRSDSDSTLLLPDLARIQPRFFLGMSHFWTDLHAEYSHRLSRMADAAIREMMEISQMRNATKPSKNQAGGQALTELAARLPTWSDLVAAWLLTREGGIAKQECIDVSRASLGGEILIAATGASHTSDEVGLLWFISLALPYT